MNCAILYCVRPVSETREARGLCAHHWWLVPRPLREPIWTAYHAWEYGYGDLATLRNAQQEAVNAVMRRSTA